MLVNWLTKTATWRIPKSPDIIPLQTGEMSFNTTPPKVLLNKEQKLAFNIAESSKSNISWTKATTIEDDSDWAQGNRQISHDQQDHQDVC